MERLYVSQPGSHEKVLLFDQGLGRGEPGDYTDTEQTVLTKIKWNTTTPQALLPPAFQVVGGLHVPVRFRFGQET